MPPAFAHVRPSDVDRLFARWDREDTPGCALAVSHRGRIIYERCYGMANLSHDIPIVPTTAFHVASLSKQFTSAAVLLLADQGRLSLDDDVRRYIPELHDFGVRLTVRHLLHHTSGLRDQWDLLILAGYRYSLDLITDDDVLELVRRQRELNFQPGTEYLYSNTGSTLAGQIVKRVSGRSLREFTTQNIFEPLAMTNTYFRDDHAEIIKGEAFGYTARKDGRFRLSITNFDTVGATSLYSTIRDLAKWDANFYKSIIGGADFPLKMVETQPLTSGRANYYAMGLMLLKYRGLAVVEHSGADAGYRANLLRFPDQQFTTIILSNTVTVPAALSRMVADLFLTSHFPMPPTAPFNENGGGIPWENARAKEGYYLSRSSHKVTKLTALEDQLQVQTSDGTFPLRANGQGQFLLPESVDPLHFEALEGGSVRMVLQGEGKPAEIWDHLSAFSLRVDARREFIGRYYSEELEALYTAEELDGKLILSRRKYQPAELVPLAPDLFASSLGAHQFERDRTGRVVIMLLTTGRVRNLRFVRLLPGTTSLGEGKGAQIRRYGGSST